jgi:predicted PurR-regulated permease PerM
MEVNLSPRARSIVIWIGAIAAGLLLLDAAHALQPFIWAIITAFILNPFVTFIHRRTRLPKHLITIWLYAMIALVITILIINFSAVVVEQVKGLQDQIPNAVDDVQTWLNTNQRDTLDRLGLDQDFVNQRLTDAGKPLADALGKAVIPVLFGTVTFAIELVIYLVASFYFIVQGDRFVAAARSLLHKRYHGEFDRLTAEISRTLGAYIRGQALLVAIMSVASFTMLSIFSVQYALIVAIATGILELIPLIGPWAAGAVAVSVALFQDGTPFGWSHLTLAIVIAIGYFGLRQMEDAFVIPLVIGRIVHLHPLLVIFVVVVGTSLGGVLGLILAVPVAAVVKILSTYFYGKLMARETRVVEVIATRRDLQTAMERFDTRFNATVVLMVEPNALDWSDLPLIQQVVDEAHENAVALSAVTPDGIAGTLFTAAGVVTTSVAAPVPVSFETMTP